MSPQVREDNLTSGTVGDRPCLPGPDSVSHFLDHTNYCRRVQRPAKIRQKYATITDRGTGSPCTRSMITCESAAAAVRGGAVIRQFAGPIGLRRKSARDLVTAADEQAQAAIFELLTQAFPDHRAAGRGTSRRRTARARRASWFGRWTRLDGTTNFVHGFPHWCVSVALLRDGQPIVGSVYDPNRDEHFWAAEGHGSFLNGDRLTVADPGELESGAGRLQFRPRSDRGIGGNPAIPAIGLRGLKRCGAPGPRR